MVKVMARGLALGMFGALVLGVGCGSCKDAQSPAGQPAPVTPTVAGKPRFLDRKDVAVARIPLGARLDRASTPRVPPKPEWMACTKDTECVHVPADCCGCKGGGASMAMNPRYLEDLAKARGEVCGPNPTCGEETNRHITCRSNAVCRNGACTLDLPGAGPMLAPAARPRAVPQELEPAH